MVVTAYTLLDIAARMDMTPEAAGTIMRTSRTGDYPFPPPQPARERPTGRMLYDTALVEAWLRHLPARDGRERCAHATTADPSGAPGDVALANYLHQTGHRASAERVWRHAIACHGQELVADCLLVEVRRRFRQLNDTTD